MDKNIETAMEEISIIKSVIEKTQKDFSKVSNFFICVGIINVVVFIAEQITYAIRNIAGYGSGIYNVAVNMVLFLPLTAYSICYLGFHKTMKSRKNEIAMGMIQIWGIVLIGTQLMSFLYMTLIPAGNNDKIITMWRCKELIVILPVMVVLLMTGVLVQRRIITYVSILYSVIYLVLFVGMKEVPYGTIGGRGTLISASSIAAKVMMILGMMLFGLYLKKRTDGSKHGDHFNTGSISD